MAVFERSVFINCPFDESYKALLRPLLFTVTYLGLTPRIALESSDSGSARFEKIIALVHESKFGIHDLSRIQARKKGEFFRLNMPFELGLDVGARRFGDKLRASKRCLILEEKPYRYQAGISDLAGSDIEAHSGEPEKLVKKLRTWFASDPECCPDAPSTSRVWGAFIEFMASNYDARKSRGFDDEEANDPSIPELMRSMALWVEHRVPVS